MTEANHETEILAETTEAYEIVGGVLRPDALAPRMILSCEHASNRLPAPWTWSASDLRLRDDHWAFDLGAESICRQLAEETGSAAVLSRFTRLLCDPNRPEDGDNLFRSLADGLPVEINTGLSDADAERRLEEYHRPYHQAMDRVAAAGARSRAHLFLSIHTFTPLYEGTPRALEVGVLYNETREPSEALRNALEKAGFVTQANEPYSGVDGFMYSVDRHARAHGLDAIELEIRQDLASDPSFRARFNRELLHALRTIYAD